MGWGRAEGASRRVGAALFQANGRRIGVEATPAERHRRGVGENHAVVQSKSAAWPTPAECRVGTAAAPRPAASRETGPVGTGRGWSLPAGTNSLTLRERIAAGAFRPDQGDRR